VCVWEVGIKADLEWTWTVLERTGGEVDGMGWDGMGYVQVS